MPIFGLRKRWAESSDFGDFGQNLTTWAIGFSNQIYSVGFAVSDCIKKTNHFFRSNSKSLKLGIGSHKNENKSK